MATLVPPGLGKNRGKKPDKPADYIALVHRYDEISFTYIDSGLALRCTAHDQVLSWCLHKNASIRDRLDGPALWKPITAAFNGEYTLKSVIPISIPLMPSRTIWAGGYLDFGLNQPFCGVPPVKVFMASPLAKQLGVPQLIGSLNPNEGYGIMRTMMLNVLEYPFVTAKECRASTHGAVEHTAYLQAQQDRVKLFEWRWLTIRRNGYCPPCYKRAVKAAEDSGIPVSDIIGTKAEDINNNSEDDDDGW